MKINRQGRSTIRKYISGFGASLSQYPGEKETFHYSITLENPGHKTYKIRSIEPIIPDTMMNLILSNDLKIQTRETLKKNKEIEIHGQVLINTSQLDAEEISRLLPLFNSFRIRFDNEEEHILYAMP